MICIFVCDRSRETIDGHLQTWGRSLDGFMRCITYESLPLRRSIAGSHFIFADLERLTDDECARAVTLEQRILSVGGRVLNRPSRVLRRFDLLHSLRASGDNPYTVCRAHDTAAISQLRFPVFVRQEREHSGSLTALIPDHAILNAELSRLTRGPRKLCDLMVVEFCDTRSGSDQFYRKYSVMRVGERFITRHVLFSENWVEKTPDVVTGALVAEEEQYLCGSPHETEVRRIFDRAKIEYGRIDYAMWNGRLVTWEINSNPTILPLPEKCADQRIAGQSRSARLVNAALKELSGEVRTIDLRALTPVVRVAELPADKCFATVVTAIAARLARTKWGYRWLKALSDAIRRGFDSVDR